jgi:hypothetical protein
MPSTPSGPPSRPTGPERSTTSWTTPEPADVISFSYLWSHEAERGQEEGLKDRPAVVIIARRNIGDDLQLLVAPVTHRQPGVGEGVPIPPRVKQHLGLDDEPSWIVTTEINQFIWPGPDVRLVEGSDDPFYGAIPAALFDQVRRQFSDNVGRTKARITPRTE